MEGQNVLPLDETIHGEVMFFRYANEMVQSKSDIE